MDSAAKVAVLQAVPDKGSLLSKVGGKLITADCRRLSFWVEILGLIRPLTTWNSSARRHFADATTVEKKSFFTARPSSFKRFHPTSVWVYIYI